MRHVPNILTGIRIVLALVFPLAAAAHRVPIVAAAMLTEYLDGSIGRWFGVTSRLGQMLDPVADKLFFFAVVLTFVREDSLSVGEVLLLGVRDVCVLAAILWTLAHKRYSLTREMKPVLSGKAVTAAQYLVCFDVLLSGRPHAAFFWGAVALSLLAAGQYAMAFRKIWRSGA